MAKNEETKEILEIKSQLRELQNKEKKKGKKKNKTKSFLNKPIQSKSILKKSKQPTLVLDFRG